MSDIETLLRQSFETHRNTVTVDGDLLDGAIARGGRRTRRRHVAFGGVAVIVSVLLVASLAIVVSVRDTDESDLVRSSEPATWWSAVEITDPSIFSGNGDTFLGQITPWQDQLVVFGVIQPNSGEADDYAWITDNGVDWERRLQDLPAGCGFHDGAVAVGDRLVVTCKIHDPDVDGGRIGVATTSDLESWTVTPISENSQWFGSLIGAGPDGSVVMQALEADDPNTTLGSTMRIWSTSDLVTWTPIAGETPTTLLNGAASAIRTFDDRIVVTGMFNDWADQADPSVVPVRMHPAIWVSTDGAPFVRTLLRSADGSTGPSAAVMDVVSTGSGYVAVGTAGDPPSGLAWISRDHVGWSTVTVAPGAPGPDVDEALSRSLWDVVVLPDGTLLAAGSGRARGGAVAEGWLSYDGGASWQSVGVGPDRVAMWNGQAVGVGSTSASQPTFWTWGGDVPARSPSGSGMVDLGSADDLEVGEVRWYAEHQLYLVRTDSTVMAFAQQSPQQGCRMALAVDLDLPEPYLPDGAVFSDPCHGASFALDGTHLGGPSPRNLDQYLVIVRAGRITVDITRLLAVAQSPLQDGVDPNRDS